jgi:CRP-like cAMP-binding protein
MGGAAAMLTSTEYTAALEDAVRRSPLSRFSDRIRGALVARSTRLDVPAKAYLRRSGERERLGLVVRGLARVVHMTDDGYDLTVTWSRSGELVNALSLVGPSTGLFIQAVTPVVWCDFDVALVRRTLQSDAEAAWVAIGILEERLRLALDEMSWFAYGDVRTRVKRLLLMIACQQPDRTLIARVTQQELASGVGAARQSVARVLGELHRAGVTRSTPDGIQVLKPHALLADPKRRESAA